MPAWLEIALRLWPVASVLTPLLMLAGFLWLRTKFPLKEDFDKLTEKVESVADTQIVTSARLDAVERDIVSEPTRVQLLAQLGVLSNKISRVEAQTTGVHDQLETTNDYLKILIDRGLSK